MIDLPDMPPQQQGMSQQVGPQQQEPSPLGLLPGMENVSPMDGVRLGISGGTVTADQSYGLEPDDNLLPTVEQADGASGGLDGQRLFEFYQHYATTKSEERLAMYKAENYYHGHHWSDEQLKELALRKQPPTHFNELRKKVDSYIGIEQRLRRDPKAYPVTPAHNIDTDVVTASIRHVDHATNAKVVFSEAGRDYFVRGIGVVWTGMEDRPDGDRVHVKKRIFGDSFFYDPSSREWDFADAMYMGEITQIDATNAAEHFERLGMPESAQRVHGLTNYSAGAIGSVEPEWRELGPEWWDRKRQIVRMIHIYYRHGNMWRCAYLVGNIKLYDQPSAYVSERGESRQPFIAVSCNVESDGRRYGVVRDMIPLQDLINHHYSKIIWLMNAKQVIYEKGAVDDVNHARRQLARSDGVIEVNPRDNGVEKRFQVNTHDKEIRHYVEVLNQAVGQLQNYGPNSALLGKEDSSQQSGRAILARQNAGMTEMSPVFERHREFKLALYKRDWELCRQFWTSEMFIRVTDDEKGVKFVALNQYIVDPQTRQVVGIENDVARMDVDIVIDEGPDVMTTNEELLQVLSQASGAPPGLQKVLIALSSAPNQDRLMKMIDEGNQASPQQLEMQERLAALEAAEKAAKIDKSIADADKARADAVANLFEKQLDPILVGQQFPFQYRQPTLVDGILGEIMSKPSTAQMQQAGQQGPGAPANAFQNDNRPMMPPQGQQMPEAMAQQPQAMPGQEPQFDQRGGLPMGNEFEQQAAG